MRVSAYDGHTGLGVPLLRTDDVDDALTTRVNVVKRDTEVSAVFAECFDLLAGDRVTDHFRTGLVRWGRCDRRSIL